MLDIVMIIHKSRNHKSYAAIKSFSNRRSLNDINDDSTICSSIKR